MDMIMLLIIVGIVVLGGGGAGYFLFINSRVKKKTWPVKIWQTTKSEKLPEKDTDGVEIHASLRLSELQWYANDLLIKDELKNLGTVYRLSKLKKNTPAVTADVIETRGLKPEDRIINVLYDGETCTLMKSGYDKITGTTIFTPLSYDTVTMIKQEIATRTARYQEQKDILTAITPWVVAGIMAFAMIGVIWIAVNGYLEVSQLNQDTFKLQAENAKEVAEILREGLVSYAREINGVDVINDLGKQSINISQTPVITS